MPVPKDYKFDLPFENGEGLDDVFRDVPAAPNLDDVGQDFKRLNCYKSNEGLMAKGVTFPYSDAHKAEFKRCKNDIFYFLMNYATIVSLDDGIMKFKLYQYQKNMIKLFQDNRFTIALLPRQLGDLV